MKAQTKYMNQLKRKNEISEINKNQKRKGCRKTKI